VWAALDLNSNVIASMPVYQTRNGQVIDPETWMTNPDDQVYSCWQEFAKQLFWDFQMGEAFIMPMAYNSDGLPQRFRVLPPHLVNVELGRGGRVYSIGSNDLTGEILHIRYKSTISDARGHGPLESALPRLVNIELLQRYVGELAKTGGVPLYWMEIDRRITPSEGQDLLTTWAENRMRNIGQPALVGHGAKLNQARTMNAKEMGLLELSQFDESRLSVLLGVPPFLMGLAGASGSLCVDTNTEILTKRGWRKYDELIIGTEVLTLNQETGMSEWQPLLDVSVFDVTNRDMISMDMTGHSSFSTNDHQWPVLWHGQHQLRQTKDLGVSDALISSAPCADQPIEAKYTDAMVELAAWWYTEGNSTYTGISRNAWLAQSADINPDHCVRIRAALTTLFGPPEANRNKRPGWTEYNYAQANGRVICQWRLNRLASDMLWEITDNIADKVLSRDFLYSLTLAQLELFIQTSIWADGCESKFTSFKQANDERLQIFELACALAGKTTQRHGSDISVTVRKRQAIKPVAADRDAKRHGRGPLIRAFQWTGRVWCPTTPNQTWFARRNGTQYFTHNTYSNIADLYDFHDRSSLRPKVRMVMESLSNWALPRGRSVELNRDDYTRLTIDKRYAAYAVGLREGFLDVDEVRAMERLGPMPQNAGRQTSAPTNNGRQDLTAAKALTGGTN
jgi:hypothetical protein